MSLKQSYLTMMENHCEMNKDSNTIDPKAAWKPLAPMPRVERYETPKCDITMLTKPKTNIDITKAKNIAQDILNDYGREILITIADITRDELEIRKELKTFLYNGVRQMMIIPDYSPVDGRLHYHGVLNITSMKDFGRSLRFIRKYIGNTWVKLPKGDGPKNMDYLFKIYEKNTKTPKGTIIEAITAKQIILKLN